MLRQIHRSRSGSFELARGSHQADLSARREPDGSIDETLQPDSLAVPVRPSIAARLEKVPCRPAGLRDQLRILGKLIGPLVCSAAVESYETPELEKLATQYRKVLSDDVGVRLPMQWAGTEAHPVNMSIP